MFSKVGYIPMPEKAMIALSKPRWENLSEIIIRTLLLSKDKTSLVPKNANIYPEYHSSN